ncbi:MAG: TauD/TfdA family dioxygenase [Rhodospirillaceae bacterium]
MEPIREPSVWLGRDIQGSSRWICRLERDEIAEIDAALRTSLAADVPLERMTRDTFPLPTLTARIAVLLDEVENGLGLYLLRGFPANDYGKDDLRRIFWGIGLHCGTAVSQSKRGDVLGDVRNIGTPHDGPEFRGYTSNGELTYHSDAADVTALFCLRAAKEGGLSRSVSLTAVHNQILEERPDLLAELYRPYHWGRQGNELPGQSPYYTQPIFAVHDGKFAGRYTRTHIRTAELGGVTPALSAAQAEALAAIDAVSARPAFHLTMMFEAGDIQFLNNHLTLHTRTAFTDFEDKDRKRHLLRLWFSPANSRALGPGFQPFFGDTAAGAVRGGFPGHTEARHFQTS